MNKNKPEGTVTTYYLTLNFKSMKKFKLLNFRNFGINQKLLRTMKLTFLFLLACFLQVSATVYSQNTKFTFDVKNKRVVDILRDIEDQSEFRFFYQREQVNVERKIDLDITDQTVENILTQIFNEVGVEFQVRNDNLILLKPAGMTYGMYEYLAENGQQQRSVSGKVTDTNNQPLPGVTVVMKGTTQGTVTNADGNYTLINIPEDATLVFSFVGMRTQEVVVGNQTRIDVRLEEETIGIEEVVAIGYGTARRKDITGSVSSVDIENSPLAMTPNVNALQSLKATTPGLNIGATNSAGQNPSLLVRGQNSLNASNYPLIVLDGVVFLGSINDINPADISSVDILKDASSAAVYGSRAANGVIIINTKRGKIGKPTLSFSSSFGVYQWIQRPQMANLDKYIEKLLIQVGSTDPLNQLFPSEVYNYQNGITYHVPDIISRTGQIQNNQLNVSGSVENLNYYLSAGYTDQKGVMIGDDYNRISLKGRINTNITDWIQFSVDGTYNRSDFSGIGVPTATIRYGDSYMAYYRGDPKDKLLEKWPNTERSPGLMPYGMNPLWPTNANKDNVVDDVDIQDFYYLNTFAHIDAPFLEGLSYRLNFARNYRTFKQERFYYENYFIEGGFFQDLERYSPATTSGFLGQAQGFVRDRKISNYVFDNIVNFKRQFDQHFVDVTLVATRDYQSDRQFQLDGNNFLDNGNTLLGIDGLPLATNQINSNAHTEFSNIGYLARLSYTLNDRYHFTSSFRRDASSVFGARNKWGNFPSVGIAWTITEEDFLSNHEFINYLKLKTSYGKNGNQGISAYETLARVTSGSTGGLRYQFSNQPGISRYGLAISALGNELLGWETTTSFNGGIEGSFLNNRLSLNLDFYFSKTVDQLFVRQIPIMTGFSSIRASMGQVDNKGIELSLNTVNVQNNKLKWTSNLTFWQNRNTLAELYGDGLDDIGNNLFIGKSLGAIYGFEWVGIVQEGDSDYITKTGARPGYPKYADLDGDGLITADKDRKILGYTKENFRLNLSNNLNYGNFEFYVLLSGIFGGGENYYLDTNQGAFLVNQPGFNREEFLDKIDYWTPQNQNNNFPSSQFNHDGRFLGLQSRSFLKVQDIIISYTFRGSWLEQMKIQGLRAHLSAQNIYTFTGWDGDPELGLGGWDRYYPVPASYSLGFNITF